MFFGRIFRENGKSLKQSQIQNHAQIVVQPLNEPEQLDNNTLILFISQRIVVVKDYMEKREFKFTFKVQPPKIEDLLRACKEFLGLNPDENISIAKYFPNKFDWKHLNPEEEIVEKKKNKEVKFKGLNADLRKMPYLLRDGDIIGVRIESENEDGKDDFKTEQDEVLRREFEIKKREDDKNKITEIGKNGWKQDNGGVVKINLDDDLPLGLLVEGNANQLIAANESQSQDFGMVTKEVSLETIN